MTFNQSLCSELSYLTRATIGWKIDGVYKEQIGLCIDEKMFATIWTNHTLHGANIDFNDKGGRPGFRIDTTGSKRFFPWATSSKMIKYYSKKNQISQVKKLLKTKNKLGDVKIIDPRKRGTNYFAKVFID